MLPEAPSGKAYLVDFSTVNETPNEALAPVVLLRAFFKAVLGVPVKPIVPVVVTEYVVLTTSPYATEIINLSFITLFELCVTVLWESYTYFE